MFARYSLSIAGSVLVTFGVLLTMQALIATAKKDLDESGSRHFVDFVRVEREETLERKERRAEKPQEPQQPPEAPEPQTDTVDPLDVSVNVAAVPVATELSISGPGLAVSDGEYLPIVKIGPTYPMRALSRGIEGYVIVEYTVTAAGTVKDVKVVEADPKGIFDKTSIEAALKFKYKPRVVNGEPIAVAGVRNIFRYRLED